MPATALRQADRAKSPYEAMLQTVEQSIASASPVFGFTRPGFEPVREAFKTSFVSGDNIGASICAYVDGEPVVDLWGGYTDAGFTQPWARDTIINTYSCTKTQTAIAAALLADRGELDLDAPVVKYWPQFGAEGKSEVLVRHLLSHASGVPGWYGPITWADVYDHEKACTILAAQPLKWAPGSASGYHGINYGHLIGEVMRRITGQSLGRFYATEVAAPLGAEFHIGVGPELDARVAPILPAVPKARPSGMNTVQDIAYFNPHMTPELAFTLPWRRAEIGGANGHGNARGLATVLSTLASGHVGRRTLLSERARARMLETQTDGIDVVLKIPVRWAMGLATASPLYDNRRGHRVAYWAGNGGSLAFADLDARLSCAFVMNRWIEGPFEPARASALYAVVEQCLEQATRA